MSRSRVLATIFVLTAAMALAACGANTAPEKKKTPEEMIRSIGADFASAPNLHLDLKTDKLPSDISGIKSAVGDGNRSPAFSGNVDLVTGGVAVAAEILAVDGKVWAKTGLSPDLLLINPKDLDAPNPALLVGTGDDGLIAIFSSAKDLTPQGKAREGNLVLETITATVPGKLIADLLPTASAKSDFAVEFRITENGVFHDLRMTGEFYKGHKTTYRLKLSIPETDVVITRPTTTS